MPPAQVGPEALRALGAALGPLRESARSGADEVLDHLPEVGDPELQSALDDYLDQVADLLREVDACVADVAARLRVVVEDRSSPYRQGLPRDPFDTSGEPCSPSQGRR